MGNDRSRQDHIQTQFKSRRVTPASTDNDTFNRVKSRMMPNLHYSTVATALAIASIGLINTPADAHQKHIHQKHRHRNGDHYSNKSKKNSAEAIRKDITRHTNIQPKNNINTTIRYKDFISQTSDLLSLFLHGELPKA